MTSAASAMAKDEVTNELCFSEEAQGSFVIQKTEGNNTKFTVQKESDIISGTAKPLFEPLILSKVNSGYEFTDGTQTQTIRFDKYIVKDNKTNHSTVFENCKKLPETLKAIIDGEKPLLPAGTDLAAYMKKYHAAVKAQAAMRSEYPSDSDYTPPKPTAEQLLGWGKNKMLADKNKQLIAKIEAKNDVRREAELNEQLEKFGEAITPQYSMPMTCDLLVTARTGEQDYDAIAYVKDGIRLGPEGEQLRAVFKPAFGKKTEAMVLVYVARRSVTDAPSVFPDTDAFIDIPGSDYSYASRNCHYE